MDLLYTNTRDASEKVTASQAILNGLAGKGGLYVPTEIPKLDVSVEELAGMSYAETAYVVMRKFLTDFTEEELRTCIARAYDEKFDTPEIAPLVCVDDAYYLELYHGATAAFKDMALSILPHLMITAARKNHIENDIVILTATSGDTGKAALSGFAGVEGTKIIVFYPKDGVSPIQERQMVTQKGDNVLVVGIRGNFDEAQTGVKKMFSDPVLAEKLEEAGYQFSSANSINIGRLVPQIVYYVYAWARLYASGEITADEEINVDVPTGNFGNILAAYYAKLMGVPIARLICASNENKVLYDFFSSGTYDKNREFILTSSPSMDILISSNLERLIYRIAGDDAEANAALMERLSETGSYDITPEMREQLGVFYGNFADEEETKDRIGELFAGTNYLIDPHTAVASAVYEKYRKETGDGSCTVIASTASPFKFTRSVLSSILTDFEIYGEEMPAEYDGEGNLIEGAAEVVTMPDPDNLPEGMEVLDIPILPEGMDMSMLPEGVDISDIDVQKIEIGAPGQPLDISLDEVLDQLDDMGAVDVLSSLAGLEVPRPIEDLRDAEVLHKTVCEIDEMESVVKDFLDIE